MPQKLKSWPDSRILAHRTTGLNALAASVAEDRGTLEDLYEPYLIQIGFLQRSPRGRIATKLAYDHLGYSNKPGFEARKLF